MKLYLVYRVRPDGQKIPEAVMSFADVDLPNAQKIYDAAVRDDNPENARQQGETWEFTPEELADRADWEKIVPPDSKARPASINPTDDNTDLLQDDAGHLLKHSNEDDLF